MADATADRDLLTEARERFELAEDAEQTLRQKAAEDLRFIYEPGKQWETEVKRERGERPCYEFNKLRPIIRQIVNEQRQNRPGLKFRGVDSQADPDTAEVYTGLVRNIFNVSDGDTILDFAFEYAVAGGYGVLGVETQFSDDTGFEQEIRLRGFQNPFVVQFDPTAKDWLKRDGRFAFVSEWMDKEEFKEQYPDASTTPFLEGEGTWRESWFTDDAVRVAEYWRRVPVQMEIALLQDGSTVELQSLEDELKPAIVRTRTVDTHRVEMFMLTANEVLDGPFDWAGKEIPLVPVYGEYVNLEGEYQYAGLARYSKDAQRSYNYHRTTLIEAIALQPKAPWQATPKQMQGFEQVYQNANKKNYSVVPYNVDPDAPMAAPKRVPPPQFPAALANESQIDANDILDTTGMTRPGMGQDEGEQSGRALLARQEKAELTTYAFQDNLNKSLKRLGEILVDLIPRIYDTQRMIRIIGEDGTEDFEPINAEMWDDESGQMVRFHDLSTGKYDVEVTTGPSYTTRRQEVTEAMLELFRVSPEWAGLMGDIFAKNLDVPESDELHKRLRRQMLQRGIVQPNEDDPEEMQIAQGDPRQKAMQEAMQQLEMADREAELRSKLAKIDETKADTAKTTAEIDEAQLGDEKVKLELIEKNFDIIAKALDNAIKRGQVEARINPMTGMIEEVGPPQDQTPQLHVGIGS